MSYHQNEKDEWLRYGAGIYLRGCDSVRIENCRVTGGQNALMMMECNYGKVVNNDFSFNSGIGIGLYRSSHHLIAYNKVNFNVRGYSHGVYHRGQDSAGFLVYEQSSNNTFYKNSATHSGDGFFLWAGQSTMDTGKGGCNDNLIAGNDFSYAPTNGVEVTFSRNIITRNRIFGCDHGIWGGYSYESLITDNQFRDNRIAIAIEHGQRNTIAYNLFIRDKQAIRLWARASQPADWGYAKYRDTRSVGYNIHHNSFSEVPLGLDISRTDSLRLFSNTWQGEGEYLQVDSLVGYIDSSVYDVDDFELTLPELANAQDPFAGSGKWAGRQHIRMGEWGPYDFRRPLIWHSNPASKSDTLQFEMLGPGGEWTIAQSRGLSEISQRKGTFPARFFAIREKNAGVEDIVIEAVYRGPAITLFDGTGVRKGKKQKFSFRHFFQPVNWQVNWFAIDTSKYNPLREPDLFPANQRLAPVKSESVDRIDYAWWGGIKSEKGTHPQFLTVAEGEADLAAGDYELSVTWDDAVRLYVDNKLVLDEWNPALYKFDESPNRRIPIKLGGKHQFRVEHVELGGFATLSVRIVRREP
jgi:parallel beta-helix repeat protein